MKANAPLKAMVNQHMEYNFTDADVEANRAGQISDNQRALLQETASRYRQQIGWGVVIGALMLALVVGWQFLRGGGTLEGLADGSNNELLVAAVIVFFVFVIVNTVRVQRMSRAMKHAQVRMAEGVVRRMEKVNAYVLERVADKPLPLYLDSPAGYGRFQEGKRYRIYYIDFKAGLVLSAEQLDEAQNS